ncbi:LysR family transcriptional regulator [Paraburkholderia phytofirmans OLGA172]|uniref:LysR family transcriptional regulator n=1 Tax=Paraburkholderia phytofirmans OLGA172 TaxID=1417228 RepID=A0A160FSF9_9BURK|nr:LysR family transcriptional regulator [Paraburkholderia phytofirmans]ANB75774.1 LysR family transcriptional regulator [Paraburkholderia phytofirmans OLGA172]
MDYIESLRIFRAVFEAKSFRRAGDMLGLTPPAVSRGISTLERRLGTRLFNRTTRQFSLMESAERVYDRCCRILDDLATLEAQICGEAPVPTGLLRVVAHTTATINRLGPLMADFKRQYPGVSLDVTLTERPVDLVGDGFDLGIVLPFMLSTDRAATRVLERIPLVLVTTKEYLAHHRRPEKPEDLSGHTFVAMPPALRKPTLTFRTERGDVAIPIKLDVVSNSPLFNQELVSLGYGIGALPVSLIESAVEEGRLVRLLDDFEIKDGWVEIRLAYGSRAVLSSKVRAFIDHASVFFDKLTHDVGHPNSG